MDKITDEISDAVLYRNLYTNILSQQINAENRLHRLMIAGQGQDKTFDEHLTKVRAKVEKDRIRIHKLAERLVIMERKEMETVSKTDRKVTSGNTSITKERKPGIFATLLNMESLRDQFKLGKNNSPNERNEQMNNASDPVTPDQNNFAQTTIDPKEIEVFFEDPFSQNTQNTTPNTSPPSTKSMDDKQGHSKRFKNLRNYPWFASQVVKDDLPKRVSFNDIPDVIAELEIRKEKLLANEESGWNSDYSEDEPGETGEQNHFNKKTAKRYHEPPPEFNYYSYHDRNRRNDPEASPKTSEQARIHNQDFNNKAVRPLHGSPKSSSKYPEAPNTREEAWDLGSDQGNSPFGSPWEGVISTSLQRQRNDSTQAVPSSTTNNEDDLLSSKTVQNNQTSDRTVPDTCKNIDTSNDNTTTTLFKMEPKEQKKIDEWLNLPKDKESKQETTEDTELYEHVVKSKRDPNFIKDEALTAMRRQSWSIHPPDKNKKQQKTRGKLASVFRRTAKNRAAQVIKADKKEFHVTKKVRRRMSLRPLPETPDVVEENEHALQCNTADSLDTFH